MPSEPHHTDTTPAEPQALRDLREAMKSIDNITRAVHDGNKTSPAFLAAYSRHVLDKHTGIRSGLGSSGGGSGHSDPTARVALEGEGSFPHQDKEITEWASTLAKAALIVERWVIRHAPRPADPETRKKLEAENKAKGIHCVPCSEAGYETESHAHTAGPATAEGTVLDRPVGCCLWHYKFLWREHAMATKAQTVAHKNGARVMVKVKTTNGGNR